VRCNRFYNELQNNETACLYHPGQLNFDNTITYSCCTATTSNGIERGTKFWIIGNLSGTTISKTLVNYLWKVWLNEEEAEVESRKYQGIKSRVGKLPEGVLVWHPHYTYSPKIDELHKVSLMLAFAVDDPSSLESLKKIHSKWEQSLGLCLNTNIPILIGISRFNPPSLLVSHKSIQEVMEIWHCNRFMTLQIGDSNAVTRAFNFLSDNFVDHLFRGCACGSHVEEIPVGDTIKNFFSSTRMIGKF